MPGDTSSAAVSRLDAALTSGPYLLIDARNRRAGEDRSRHPRAGFVGTLEQAQAAVVACVLGATTYAGTVRAGVAAFDIDAADPRLAAYLVEELTGWASRRRLWNLAVDSGGGPGRKHVFVVPERFSAELAVLVGLLRAERGLGRRELDDRTGGRLRPPGAPHRTSSADHAGAAAAAVAEQLRHDGTSVDELVDELERALTRSAKVNSPAGTQAGASNRRRRPSASTASTSGAEPGQTGPAATVVCLPRQDPAAPMWPGRAVTDNSRSAQEFALTRQLVDAGETPEKAWETIAGLNGKSASRGFTWWRKYLWQRVRPRTARLFRAAQPPVSSTPSGRSGLVDLAERATAGLPTEGPRRPPVRLEHTNAAVVVLPTFAANRYRWARLDTRQRHSLETVLWAVLERLDPDRAKWTPLSLRDLRLATGLDRSTISSRLRHLVQLGLIRRRQLPALEAADQWQLGLAARTALNPPAVLTPPAPCWCPSSPAGTTTTLLDHLLPPAPPNPAQPPLQPAAPRSNSGSTRQTRLAAARTDAAAQLLRSRRLQLCERHHQLLAQVTAERDPFYDSLRTHRSLRMTTWEDGRHQAFTAQAERHQRWWSHLSSADQDQRREDARTRWAALPRTSRSAWLERRHTRRLILDGDRAARLHSRPTTRPEALTRPQLGAPKTSTQDTSGNVRGITYGERSTAELRHERDQTQLLVEIARNTPDRNSDRSSTGIRFGPVTSGDT